MALYLFVGHWALFKFFILYTIGRDPWTGDQHVARPLPAYRTIQTQIPLPRIGFELMTPSV
jgi:hypothetical protein